MKCCALAPGDNASTAIFLVQKLLLASAAAEGFLISHLEPDDKKAQQHLEQRSELLRELRMGTV